MNPALFRRLSSDSAIWDSVVNHNEYRLPDRFEPNSLVLDIGGNTGAFTYACIQRGAEKVIAFEPDPDNFAIFRKQLKQELKDGRVEVYPLAVVGGSGFSWRTFSGTVVSDGQINHGGAFLFTEDGGDYGLGKFIEGRPFTVPCIGVKEVLDRWPKAALMKLDCEGSEFPIVDFMWTQTLGDNLPQKISGEYHPSEGKPKGRLMESFDAAKYVTEMVPHPNSELGLFFATRK